MKSGSTTSSEAAGIFARTQWSIVLKAARQSEDATQAFDRLAKVYWRPLYEFVRRRGHQPADAKDIIQDFFKFLMEKKPLGSVDPAKGRFRSFLLGVLRHFMANRKALQNAQKRGNGRRDVSLEDLAHNTEVVSGFTIDCSPDEVFDTEWAETLVSHTILQLKAEYETAGRAALFASLNAYLNHQSDQSCYAAAAQELGMSEDAVKMAVHRLRRRFREVLRSWIAQTVSNEEDVANEYRYLTQVLTRSRG